MVNGYVKKGDGNFEGPFFLKTLEGRNISIGSYPQSDQDYATIKQAGCTGVLDIQNNYRGVDFAVEQQTFRRFGISAVKNIKVWDTYESKYISDLFEAAVELDNMINKQNLHVFVHCNTGISRGPTLVILYFALFLRHEKWNDIGELEHYIMNEYNICNPNTDIVEEVLRLNATFQNEQKQRQQEEDEARRNKIMQMDRMNQLKNMKDEYERLKRKKLAEADAEKSRLQRALYAEEEALRKWKQQQDDLERERRRKERELEQLYKSNLEKDEDMDRQRQEKIKRDQAAHDLELERIRRETEEYQRKTKEF